MSETRIDWSITVRALALLGYECKLPEGFDALSTEGQLEVWDHVVANYMTCEMHCAWKGGGPCISMECPRRVLRRASLTALPLARRPPHA